jgi:hypothetical protein
MAEHPKPLAAPQTFPLSNSAVNFISTNKSTIPILKIGDRRILLRSCALETNEELFFVG